MRGYTHPEEYKSRYFYNGQEAVISRKAALTDLMSNICDKVYSLTPVINNEAMNRNEITSTANNSRNKIVTALLRNELEPNLGLTGTGQEVSIMRSTLIRTGVLEDNGGLPRINLMPDKVEHIAEMLSVIETFIVETRTSGSQSFEELYYRLTSPEHHIGLRKGLIPIYLASVIREYKKEVIIADQYGPIAVTADVIQQINSRPKAFSLSYLDWSPEKEAFVSSLADSFAEYIIDAERNANPYDYVASAMRRWYMALPKVVKESKNGPTGEKLQKSNLEMLKLLKRNVSGNELLFEKLPKAFGGTVPNESIANQVRESKLYYDKYLHELKKALCDEVKDIFVLPEDRINMNKMSFASVIKDWCESLDPTVYEQLFADGTEKCLALFKSISNDDDATISRLAKLATDLRIEDWDDKYRAVFIANVKKYKETAETHHASIKNEELSHSTGTYEIAYTDDNGEIVTKRFERIDSTKKGQLLHNQVTAALASMGRSISDQEKRQILMDILKDLC